MHNLVIATESSLSLADSTMPSDPDERVIAVSELNRLARLFLENHIPRCWINGEISNWMVAVSGHAYFALKDDKAQVRCVMFRHQLAKLNLALANGLQVELCGQVSLYEARGDFQINVEMVRSSGLGRLFEAFNRLKKQLSQEGLFDASKKQVLPRYPQTIGVITSVNASVLRDVLSILQKYAPSLPAILYPTAVQGVDAPQQIVQAIEVANQRREVDVLIICRGGGSLEDLAAFNDERVVRQIAASAIATISGVGHETDITLCDFAADYRAETPTAAATAVSAGYAAIPKQLSYVMTHLQSAITWQMNHKLQQLDHWAARLVSPWQKWQSKGDKLASIRTKLIYRTHQALDQHHMRLAQFFLRLQKGLPELLTPRTHTERAQMRLKNAMQQQWRDLVNRAHQCYIKLSALNPTLILEKGYAIVRKEDGTPIYTADVLMHGERVTLEFNAGTAKAIIDKSSEITPVD